MRLVPRGPRPGVVPVTALVTALFAAAVVTGCGASVADADAPRQRSTAAAPQTPFCAAVQANSTALRPLNGLALRGGLPAAELAATVDTARRAGTDLVNASPGEIRPDTERVVTSIGIQLDALVAAGGDAVAAGRDPTFAAQQGNPDVTAANQRLSAYVDVNCSSR